LETESISTERIIAELCRGFPGYRIEHFYHKSFREGGVTYGQIGELYKQLLEIKWDELRQQAALQGVDLDKEVEKGGTGSDVPAPKGQPVSPSIGLFKDPKEYDGMSAEERETETKKMMATYRQWAGDLGAKDSNGNKSSSWV